MRYLLAILMILSLSGCGTKNELAERVMRDIDAEELSRIVIDFTTELFHKRHLVLEKSYLVYTTPRPIIRLQFSSQAILEVKEARTLLVDVAEGLVEVINRTALPIDLLPYPIDYTNLELTFDFQSYYGKYVDPYYVGWMVLEKGWAYYYAFTIKNCKLDLWHLRNEPYFKSRSFVASERQAEENFILRHEPPKKTNFEERYHRPPSAIIR